jgi:hypothetical protein
LTPAMALPKLCGNGPVLWLNLQRAYGLWRAERERRTGSRRLRRIGRREAAPRALKPSAVYWAPTWNPNVSVTAFNTHAFVKRLTAAGMPEAQAEALADELRPLVEDRLATKDDLANLGTKIDLADLRDATKMDLAEAKFDMLKWTFGAIGFQTVIVLGAVGALARMGH